MAKAIIQAKHFGVCSTTECERTGGADTQIINATLVSEIGEQLWHLIATKGIHTAPIDICNICDSAQARWAAN